MSVMEVPVYDRRSGIIFERSAILEWIYFGNATCPLTRKPLTTRDLARDFKLQREISEWRKEHCPELVADSDSDSDREPDDEDEEDIPVRTETAAPDRNQARLGDIRSRVLLKRKQWIQDELKSVQEQS